jgi:transcription factor TGA
MFEMEYARWLDDDSKRLAELRSGLQAHLLDGNLGLIVEECMQHYDELFQLKAELAHSDVFHLLTGTWVTPADRCFFWMGGFRPSELLKVRPSIHVVEARAPSFRAHVLTERLLASWECRY